MKHLFRKTGYWIWIFLLTDLTFLFTIWLTNPDAVSYMLPFLLLFTLLMVFAGAMTEKRKKEKDQAAISSFLDQPDEKTAAELCSYFGNDRTVQNAVAEYMRVRNLVRETGLQKDDYQEYIEAWVHEVKTPISLMELMLENHRDEMSPYVSQRLHYAVHKLTEDTERILYFRV